MACRGRPYVRVAQGMGDGSVTTGAFPEHAAPAQATASEPPLDNREHLVGQKVFPGPRGGRVDILIATDARKAVRKGDDDRRHEMLADKAIKPFGHIFLE